MIIDPLYHITHKSTRFPKIVLLIFGNNNSKEKSRLIPSGSRNYEVQRQEHGPGHSEQGTWRTSWNIGQTEGTEIRPLSIDVCLDQRHLMTIFGKTCISVLAAKCEDD